MKKVNEKDVAFKYEKSGSKYLFNEESFAGGVAYLNPGDEIKLHVHETETEIFYFIKGTPIFYAGNSQMRVAEGDSFLIYAKEPHGIKNDTNDTVQLTFVKIKVK
jgi:quercetin dioxygenase-like cupin family protein